MRKLVFVALVIASLPACGSRETTDDPVEGEPDGGAQPAPDAGEPQVAVGFTRYLVTDQMPGPAYVSVADLNGDGDDELVVSALGVMSGMFAGELTIFERTGDLDEWTATTLSTDFKFANQSSVLDIDDDGDLDIVQPAGFFACLFLATQCGDIAWFEQTADGWTRHDIVTGDPLFFHHVEVVDFDGDGIRDLVTVGEWFNPPSEGGAELRLYKGNDSADRFDKTPMTLFEGLGGFPRVRDVDGDGDLDVAAAEFFYGDDSFAWMERRDDGGWQRHVINSDSGPSIQLAFVDDLYGDGVTRAVGSNHTNTERNPPDEWESAIFVFDIPADPTQPWPKTQISTGIVSRAGDLQQNRYDAPGVFGTGDVDGDGDLDIAVAGDGDPRAFWLEQTAPGELTTHVLQDQLGQAGGMVITDLDHDGKNEIVVTGYEDNVVYIYERD